MSERRKSLTNMHTCMRVRMHLQICKHMEDSIHTLSSVSPLIWALSWIIGANCTTPSRATSSKLSQLPEGARFCFLGWQVHLLCLEH